MNFYENDCDKGYLVIKRYQSYPIKIAQIFFLVKFTSSKKSSIENQC